MKIDSRLVLTALTVHDLGEGEIGKDTLYLDKNISADLEEYKGFRNRYEPLGKSFDCLNRAFLLQFAIKNPPEFPEDAKKNYEKIGKGK